MTPTAPPATTPRGDAPPVDYPATADEAIARARAFADRIRDTARDRDRDRVLPYADLEELRGTGLLALPVPAADGGPGASTRTIAAVFRILATGDPALTQVVQPHFSFVDTLARHGSPEQRELLLGEVLRGARFGNALSERGGKHAFDFTTTLTARGGGDHVLNGVKYYSTGALGADWIAVFAVDDAGEPVVAYIPGDTPGVSVGQDWSAFGQRATLSGTTTLDDVAVPDLLVVRDVVEQDGVATTVGAYAQILHGAIDAGIARGALEDGARFIRDHARAWPAAGVERPRDEVHVQEQFGRLLTLIEAAEEYLGRAGDLMDAAVADPTPEAITAARLGVATAKAFAGDVALETATAVLDAGGSSATDEKYGLDRHWRNARTHTLHDPNRWKYIHAGRFLLDGVAPPASDHSI
jgi:SfnB family sulfur acquisition oxidoreductase